MATPYHVPFSPDQAWPSREPSEQEMTENGPRVNPAQRAGLSCGLPDKQRAPYVDDQEQGQAETHHRQRPAQNADQQHPYQTGPRRQPRPGQRQGLCRHAPAPTQDIALDDGNHQAKGDQCHQDPVRQAEQQPMCRSMPQRISFGTSEKLLESARLVTAKVSEWRAIASACVGQRRSYSRTDHACLGFDTRIPTKGGAGPCHACRGHNGIEFRHPILARCQVWNVVVG